MGKKLLITLLAFLFVLIVFVNLAIFVFYPKYVESVEKREVNEAATAHLTYALLKNYELFVSDFTNPVRIDNLTSYETREDILAELLQFKPILDDFSYSGNFEDYFNLTINSYKGWAKEIPNLEEEITPSEADYIVIYRPIKLGLIEKFEGGSLAYKKIKNRWMITFTTR